MLTTLGGINMEEKMITVSANAIAKMVGLVKNFEYGDMLVYYAGYIGEIYAMDFNDDYVPESRFKLDILIIDGSNLIYNNNIYAYEDGGLKYVNDERKDYEKDNEGYIKRMVDMIMTGHSIIPW